MKMGLRSRSVSAAALATEVELLWRSQSLRSRLAGTLLNQTNCSLRKLRRARLEDFRFSEASNEFRISSFASRILASQVSRSVDGNRSVHGGEMYYGRAGRCPGPSPRPAIRHWIPPVSVR